MGSCDTDDPMASNVTTCVPNGVDLSEGNGKRVGNVATKMTRPGPITEQARPDFQLLTRGGKPLGCDLCSRCKKNSIRVQSLPNIMFSPYAVIANSEELIPDPNFVSERRESASKSRLKEIPRGFESIPISKLEGDSPVAPTYRDSKLSISSQDDGRLREDETNQEEPLREEEERGENDCSDVKSSLQAADISDTAVPIAPPDSPTPLITTPGDKAEFVNENSLFTDSSLSTRRNNQIRLPSTTNPFTNLELLWSIRSETPTPNAFMEDALKNSPFFEKNSEQNLDSDTVNSDKEKRFESVVIRKFGSLKSVENRYINNGQSENSESHNISNASGVPAKGHYNNQISLSSINENSTEGTLSSKGSDNVTHNTLQVKTVFGKISDQAIPEYRSSMESMINPMKPLTNAVDTDSTSSSIHTSQMDVNDEKCGTTSYEGGSAQRNSCATHANTTEWDDIPLDTTVNDSNIFGHVNGHLTHFNLTNIPLKVEEDSVFPPIQGSTNSTISETQDTLPITSIPREVSPGDFFDRRMVLQSRVSSLESSSNGTSNVLDESGSNETKHGLANVNIYPKAENPFRTGVQALEDLYLEECAKIRTEIFYSPTNLLVPKIGQRPSNSASECTSRSNGSGSRDTSESSNQYSFETVPTPMIQPEAKVEDIYIDDPFGFNQMEPEDGLGKHESKKGENYLTVWSTQESTLQAKEKRSESIRSDVLPERQLAVQKQLLDSKRNFSFRPTSISRSRYHYHPSPQPDNASIDKMGTTIREETEEVACTTLGDVTNNDNVSLSLSEEIDRIFGKFGTDSPFVESEPLGSPGPVKIWSKGATVPTHVEEEQHNVGNKVSFEEALADDINRGKLKISGVYPPSVKNFTCNVRSCQASVADEELAESERSVETKVTKSSSPAKQPESPFLREHIRSPFKVRSSKYTKSPNVQELTKFDKALRAKLRASTELTKPVIIEKQPTATKRGTATESKVTSGNNVDQSSADKGSNPQTSEMPSTTPSKPSDSISQAISLIDIQDQYKKGPQVKSEEEQSKLIDYGVVYVFVEKIKVSIEDIQRHKATFSLEANNGINVTQTEWSKVGKDNYLVIGKEFELPVTSFDQKLTFTLRCRYTRPESELVEVVEKINVGRSLGGLGKTKYAYEKKFVQKPVEFDEWDYAFAPDGSAGFLELSLQKDFLKRIKFRRDCVLHYAMVNKWARIYDKKKDPKLRHELPHRQPYTVGKMKLWACFIKRTSNSERFPKTMTLVNDIIKKYKQQAEIMREGFLMQEGGDAKDGLIKRYFKLKGTELIGYHEISRNPKIKINLLKVKSIEEKGIGIRPGGRYFTDSLLDSSFKLVFENGECITLNSEISRGDAREWCRKIKESVDLNFVHQPWVKKFVTNLAKQPV